MKLTSYFTHHNYQTTRSWRRPVILLIFIIAIRCVCTNLVGRSLIIPLQTIQFVLVIILIPFYIITCTYIYNIQYTRIMFTVNAHRYRVPENPWYQPAENLLKRNDTSGVSENIQHNILDSTKVETFEKYQFFPPRCISVVHINTILENVLHVVQICNFGCMTPIGSSQGQG